MYPKSLCYKNVMKEESYNYGSTIVPNSMFSTSCLIFFSSLPTLLSLREPLGIPNLTVWVDLFNPQVSPMWCHPSQLKIVATRATTKCLQGPNLGPLTARHLPFKLILSLSLFLIHSTLLSCLLSRVSTIWPKEHKGNINYQRSDEVIPSQESS